MLDLGYRLELRLFIFGFLTHIRVASAFVLVVYRQYLRLEDLQ